MNLTPEERAVGQDNYHAAVTAHDQVTRRGFLQQVLGAGAVTAAGIGGLYFGYSKPSRPVRIGIIGTGDEGNVLIGALNPDYVQVVHIADIRPSSIHRAVHGDWETANTIKVRPGLMSVYDWKSEDEVRQHVKISTDYREVLSNPDVEGVIIAVPLHLHAAMTVEALKQGKHVLVEKLMAHNVAQCKLMARVSDQTRKYLSIGHQRHYSILYDNAVNLIRWGLLGEIHHIRAQWHRNNLPGRDTWAKPVPGGEQVRGQTGPDGQPKRIDKIADDLKRFQKQLTGDSLSPSQRARLQKKVAQWIAWDQDKDVRAEDYGYISDQEVLGDGRTRSALEELVRWRLWNRTGGGLMAELGSHQLDAASIFISALSEKKVHPLSVYGVGGRHLFPSDRDADDHVYCMFEFPGPGYEPGFRVGYEDRINQVPDPTKGIPSYEQDPNKKIVVTYSSVNGNGFGGYGEVVLGTKGTLVLEKEKEVMLYSSNSTSARVGVSSDAGGATLDTTASGDVGPAKAAETGPVSRGYSEQIEHWAWCIRSGDWGNQPRCTPQIALADAVIALTAKLAIHRSNHGGHGFISFDPAWFDVASDAVPESDGTAGTSPTIANQSKLLGL